MTSETARTSSTDAKRNAASLSTWILGLSVSLLSANAFVMLAAGVLLGLVVTLGLPMIVADVLAVPVLAAALWIGIWVCCRVVDVERHVAHGGNTPPAAMHLLKPWVTVDK